MKLAASTKKFKKIYIEISNVCNLQCSFCPEVERDKKIMGPDLFQKIIKQSAPLAEEIALHVMGEPLLHPELEKFISLCELYDTPINLTTNGTLLHTKNQNILLHPSIRQINFSLHSFAANHSKNEITPYLENIFSFTQHAHKNRPNLYINYRIWNLEGKNSGYEMNELILKKIEDHFNLTINRNIDVRWKKYKKIKSYLNLHFDTEFTWPSLKSPVRSQTGFCHGLSSHFGIHADGTVVPCCLDKEAEISLGNCQESDLAQIINSNRAQKIIAGFKNRHLVEDLCQRCQFRERFN